MTVWPSATDYQAALQHPAQAFRDPLLQAARAETNRMGVPRARSGQFAIVYKLVNGIDAKAVRVFRDPQADRQERYRAVSDHVGQARPRGLVGFAYDPQGIRVVGQWYPVLVMDWVSGPSLAEWMGERVRLRETERLGQMSHRWARLVAELQAARVAHGDLQHDNVLVVRDAPVLVDYDGMCVPQLVGLEALEHGKPAYQHPRRREERLSLTVDHFAAWAILLGLRAVADDPSLWEAFVSATGNENVLFTEADHLDPERSALWQRLLAARSPKVRGWARQLRACLPDQPFHVIPAFQPETEPALPQTKPVVRSPEPPPGPVIWTRSATVIPTPNPGPRPAPTPLPLATTGTALEGPASGYPPAGGEDFGAIFDEVVIDTVFPPVGDGNTVLEASLFEPLRAACRLVPPDWDAIHNLATQPPLVNHSAPGDLTPVLDEARARIAARERLRAALAGRSPRQIVEAYEPRRLDDWAACSPLVAQVRQAQTLLRLLAELEAARQNPGDGRRLVALWGRHAGALSRLPETAALNQAVQQWAARIRACEEFLALVAQPAAGERALADAWAALARTGGHPDAGAHRLRAEQAEIRAACLEGLRAVPPGDGEEQDEQLYRAWDDSLLRGCVEAAALRPRYEAARRRLDLLAGVRRALAALPSGGDEAPVVAAAALLPPDYPHRLQPRVEKARLRVQARSGLGRALQGPPRSDLALAEAWEKAQAQGSLQCSRTVIERCELAIRRRDCLRALEAIGAALPTDEQDAEWLRLWDRALLEPCTDAARARQRFHIARERTRAWHEFEGVLGARDLRRIKDAVAHPLLAGYPAVLRRQPDIDELLQGAAKLELCEDLLRRGDPSGFANGVDFQFVREHPEYLLPHRDRIEGLLQRWLNNEVRMSACDPPFVTAADGSRVTVRWTWPYFGRVSHCRVATHTARFFATPDEAEKAKVGTARLNAEDHRRAGGMSVSVLPGRRAIYVTVWPAIDLGWTELVGDRPLNVGPVVPRARGR